MTDEERIQPTMEKPERLTKRFRHGPAHVFNPIPRNAEEALAHGNALAASGNYPVGTDGCFNVGISGGCGIECYVYLNGECGEPQELLPGLTTTEELERHRCLYPRRGMEEK